MTDRQRQTDRQTDRQAGRQADRQRDKDRVYKSKRTAEETRQKYHAMDDS